MRRTPALGTPSVKLQPAKSEAIKLDSSATITTNHTRPIYAVCAITNYLVATGADDGFVRLWDLKELRMDRVYRGHSAGVRCLCLLPNGLLASGSWDKTIRFWDLEARPQ